MTKLVIAVVATMLAAQAAGAQGSPTPPPQPPTDAQMKQMQTNSLKLRHPAEWVLEAKTELNLRPDQVEKLQNMVLALRDSESVRMTRMMSSMSKAPMAPTAMTKAMSEWSGPVDETAIREAMCEQSKMTAEGMLDMIKDRHAIGAILTEAQRIQLPAIQSKLISSGMGKP